MNIGIISFQKKEESGSWDDLVLRVCMVSHNKSLDLFSRRVFWHKYYDTVRHDKQYITFGYIISVQYKITMLQSCNIYINISIVVTIMKKLE